MKQLLARSWLLIAMLASIGLVFTVALWSAARQREDSLADFSSRQALLATAVGADFEARLPKTAADDEVVLASLAGARRVESPGSQIVLVARPNASGFLTTDKRIIVSSRLRAALDQGERSLIIPRDEASSFGLPRRTAVAGLARIPMHDGSTWDVVVLASAQRLRDRQILEDRRLGVTVAVVTLVVAAFGVIARRRQASKLELERRIVVASLERENEAALAKADKMAALAALSTGIAHEVGTPLGVIVGRVEQAMARVEDERAKRALDVVLEQVERIRSIVRGCLSLARGDSPELVRTPPEKLAERASDLVQHRFAKAEVALDCAIEKGLPEIACTPALFEQALVNLLLNACEATSEGGSVRLSIEAVDSEVRFVVEDEGAGIPDDVAQRAVEPFFTTRLSQGGSGLGLTIAREIINHHSGRLTVEKRDDGAGTKATIAISPVTALG